MVNQPATHDDLAAAAQGFAADFGLTAADYATHRAGFPAAFFARLRANGWVSAGQKAVDLGTGTGTIARGLAKIGCSVIGVDPAEPMLHEARRLAEADALAITWQVGQAEALDCPNASVDLVTAGQCWHWFDGPRTLAEVWRVLRPGGRLIIAHFDWLPVTGNVVAATEQLIAEANPSWKLGGGCGVYPTWFRQLDATAFQEVESFTFDVTVPYTHAGWRGRIRASAGIRGALSAAAVDAFDQRLGQRLAQRFPDDPMGIPHRVFAVTGVKGDGRDG